MDPKKKKRIISDTKIILFLFAIVIVFSIIKGGIENSTEPLIEKPAQIVEEPKVEGIIPQPEQIIEEQPQIEEEPEEVEPEKTEPGVFEVSLTKDKLMDPNNIKVKKGTVVKWFNKDVLFYHNIVIYPASIEIPVSTDVIAQSGNIDPGDHWDYVFENSGEYAVKDIYSGTMRGQITAEVISEILEKGEFVGKIIVE